MTTTDDEWVIKLARDKEIKVIGMVRLTKPRHTIALPPIDRLCGRGWYALKRYDGALQHEEHYDWRRIAVCVLEFLEDFHHSTKLCHNDIKLENIFLDGADFVVGDFGDSLKPTTELLEEKNYVDRWHYVTMGAEIGEPVHSWRLDFVALGYMLAKITLEPSQYTFHKECRYRQKQADETMSDKDLFTLRSKQVGQADPTILAYLEQVAVRVPWKSTKPPPKSVYRSLAALFAPR